MPPKKKKHVVLPTRPPGLLKKYLTENFSPPPTSDLLNGHVLFLFVENDRSNPRTVEAVKERTTEPALAVNPSKVRQLVGKTILKYKRLDRESDMRYLDAVCHERFICGPRTPEGGQATENVPTVSIPPVTPPASEELSSQIPSSSGTCTYDQSSTSISGPQPSKSGRQLRGQVLAPRRAKLKKRLEFATKSKSDIKKKHQEKMKEVRLKVRKPDKVKHLNQIIKRKQAVIIKLQKHQFRDVGKELTETKRKLSLLQQAHIRMKFYMYRKQRRGFSRSSSENPDEQVYKLQEELKSRNAEIRVLEKEKWELKEIIESLHASSSLLSL